MIEAERRAGDRILIVEDDPSVALALRELLVRAGHRVEIRYQAEGVEERLERDGVDLLLLDLRLPGLSGLELLERIRDRGRDPRVVVLTGVEDEEVLVQAFRRGADDFLTKPCSSRELLARVEAQLRRRRLELEPPRRLALAPGVAVDLARLEVFRDDRVTNLTEREGRLLEYLIAHRDRVVTREELLAEVWHYANPRIETRTVDTHIADLRRKIEPDPAHPRLIATVRGRGYRWSGA